MHRCLVGLTILATSVFAADIQLPAPVKTGGMPLMEALAARQSQRTFSSQPLSEQQLANLLWAACGINRESGKRTAPTARNAQEIDVYVALTSGLYRYDAPANKLVQILETDIREDVGNAPFTQQAPVGLIYVADAAKLKSEVFQATDTGYISQNVYLFCASEKMSTVVLGGFNREKLSGILKLTPEQTIILTQPVGFPRE